MRFNGTVREGLKTGSYKGSSLDSHKGDWEMADSKVRIREERMIHIKREGI